MYFPITFSSSIFLLLMVIQGALSSPVHKYKDCGLKSCEITTEKPPQSYNDVSHVINAENYQLLSDLLKQLKKQDPSEHKEKNKGNGENHKQESRTQLSKHEFSHAESVIENLSSYENSGESKKKLIEIETKISQNELTDGKPTIKNLYSYKKLSGSDQQFKELETQLSKQAQGPANVAEIDENLLKLLPKLSYQKHVSDNKNINSVIEDSHSYENSAESNSKVIESGAKVFLQNISNGKFINEDSDAYKKLVESSHKLKQLESKVYKNDLAIVKPKVDDAESNNSDKIIKLVAQLLSKDAQQNKYLIESKPKLPEQAATHINSVIQNSHSFENAGESNTKLVESASKVSNFQLFNGEPVSNDLLAYKKSDESSRRYEESENKGSKHEVTIDSSKVNDKESNNSDDLKRVLAELLSKLGKKNPEPESKLPQQEVTHVNSVVENSHASEKSGESNSVVTESVSQNSNYQLSNGEPVSNDLLTYKKTDESSRRYEESENKGSKHEVTIDSSKVNDKESKNSDDLKAVLAELLSKLQKKNPEPESKLPKQEVTHVNAVIENSHASEKSGESNSVVTESVSQNSNNHLSNGEPVSKGLLTYKKSDESSRRYEESENKDSKHELTIDSSKVNDKESNNSDDLKAVLAELLSKLQKKNPKPESKKPVSNDLLTYRKSDESSRRYEESENKDSKHELTIESSKVNDKESNNSDDLKAVLAELLSKLGKKNPEPELPKQEVTHVNSVVENSHASEKSGESNNVVTESVSQNSNYQLSNGEPVSKDLLTYKKSDESSRRYEESENKGSKHELTIDSSKVNDKESNNSDDLKAVLAELLSKLQKKNPKPESKLPKQEVTHVNSVVENSHASEKSGESNSVVTESASKVSNYQLSNGEPVRKELINYKKSDESSKRYEESENKDSKHELNIDSSKVNDKESNNSDDLKAVLAELLSKLQKKNPKPESKEPVSNDLLTYKKSDQSSRRYEESENKDSKHELTIESSKVNDKESNNSNDLKAVLAELLSKLQKKNPKPESKEPVSNDLLTYKKSDESSRRYEESENKDSKHELTIESSKVNDKESNNSDDLKAVLAELLSKLQKKNPKPESKLPKQEVTHVNSVIENSHASEKSGESNSVVTESVSQNSNYELSNGEPVSKDLLTYKKSDESSRRYEESENKGSKHELTIDNSKVNDKESNNSDDLKSVLVELLSKLGKNRKYKEPENKAPLQRLTIDISKLNDKESIPELVELLLEVAKKNYGSASYDEIINILIKVLSGQIELKKPNSANKTPLEPKKQPCEQDEKSSPRKVEDISILISGLLSNKNSIETNNQILRLGSEIYKKEFVSAVAIIDELLHQNIPYVTKQKLIELKVKLLVHIPSNQISDNSGVISHKSSGQSSNSFKQLLEALNKNYAESNNNLIVSKLPKFKLTILKPTVDVVSSTHKIDANNEVVKELLNKLQSYGYH